MYAKLNHFDLTGCATREDLVQLFEEAFDQWKKNSLDPVDRRVSPRLQADHIKPLFVVSYSYNGKEVELLRRVPIVDISADGLGMETREPIPVGSSLCFAFENEQSERNFGVATVVRLLRHKNDYLIGLTFSENAQSINVDQSISLHESWGAWLTKSCHAWGCIRRNLTRRHYAHRSLQKSLGGKLIRFDVRAKLFRYVATLYIDGQKVKTETRPLNDRLRNIFANDASPTIINMEADGFLVWATLRTNKVSYISIQDDIPQTLNDNVVDYDQPSRTHDAKTLMASLKDIESDLRSLSVS